MKWIWALLAFFALAEPSSAADEPKTYQFPVDKRGMLLMQGSDELQKLSAASILEKIIPDLKAIFIEVERGKGRGFDGKKVYELVTLLGRPKAAGGNICGAEALTVRAYGSSSGHFEWRLQEFSHRYRAIIPAPDANTSFEELDILCNVSPVDFFKLDGISRKGLSEAGVAMLVVATVVAVGQKASQLAIDCHSASPNDCGTNPAAALTGVTPEEIYAVSACQNQSPECFHVSFAGRRARFSAEFNVSSAGAIDRVTLIP